MRPEPARAVFAPPPSLRDSLALADRRRMKVERLEIGGRPALIVDGLYADPEAVREVALSLDFHRTAGLYPGCFAYLSIQPLVLLALLNDLLAEPLGRGLTFSPYYRDLTFAMTMTPPERLAPLQRQPHFDTFCDFAGVIYLGPQEGDWEGGTSFWRHRRTGLERAPGDRAAGERSASGGVGEVERMMLEGVVDLPDGYPVQSGAHWEIASVVPMRFNRLVAYDARAFHSPHIPTFLPAADPRHGRLTQNLFLEFLPPDRHIQTPPAGGA